MKRAENQFYEHCNQIDPGERGTEDAETTAGDFWQSVLVNQKALSNWISVKSDF
jgi:hypothetical protein